MGKYETNHAKLVQDSLSAARILTMCMGDVSAYVLRVEYRHRTKINKDVHISQNIIYAPLLLKAK